MTQATENRPTGTEVITEFLKHSPFVLHLGIRLVEIEPDRARLAMPYREELATIVGLSVDFLAAAQGQQVIAEARVLRRGRNLCFCDVDVTDAGGRLVAKGIVTYKL